MLGAQLGQALVQFVIGWPVGHGASLAPPDGCFTAAGQMDIKPAANAAWPEAGAPRRVDVRTGAAVATGPNR